MHLLCLIEDNRGNRPSSPLISQRMLIQIHQRPQGISPLVCGTAEIMTVLANPTTDQDVSEEAPDSPVASSNGDTRDTKQPGSL